MPHRARIDGRLPRARRGAARGQGIRRPGRGHHQLPPCHVRPDGRRSRASGRTDSRLRGQVPFVHGGAEILVRELVGELRAHGCEAERVVAAVQVVSEGRDPAARGRVAAARSEREQRPADRSRHRHEVPDLLRAPSEQGRLARAPAPRRIRAVRHAVQRLRAHRARCRPARARSSTLDTQMLRRVPAAVYDRANTAAASRSTTASPPTPLYHPPLLAPRDAHRPTATTCCRSAGSKR